MSKPLFTPGPWCLSLSGGYVRRTLHGYNIAALNNALEEHPANASLIAAAPDLYARLKTIADELSDLLSGKCEGGHPDIDDVTRTDLTALCDDAYAAIAKAEGSNGP